MWGLKEVNSVRVEGHEGNRGYDYNPGESPGSRDTSGRRSTCAVRRAQDCCHRNYGSPTQWQSQDYGLVNHWTAARKEKEQHSSEPAAREAMKRSECSSDGYACRPSQGGPDACRHGGHTDGQQEQGRFRQASHCCHGCEKKRTNAGGNCTTDCSGTRHPDRPTVGRRAWRALGRRLRLWCGHGLGDSDVSKVQPLLGHRPGKKYSADSRQERRTLRAASWRAECFEIPISAWSTLAQAAHTACAAGGQPICWLRRRR